MENIYGSVHSIESFGSADGPGVRFMVFLQGCNMRCKYCHNPDTWEVDTGKLMTPEQIIKQALRYRPYWKGKGGITVSGGEALLQIDFLIALFTLAKQENINTCLDTSGSIFSLEEPFITKFKELMALTDLFLLDIKHINDEDHRKLTGRSNKNILAMAQFLSDNHKPMWIRHVLVPGITDNDKSLHELKDFLNTLTSVEKVEVLPYHTLGVFKWEEKGIPYPLDKVSPPSKESLEHAKKILELNS